jgi:hypothetical protein
MFGDTPLYSLNKTPALWQQRNEQLSHITACGVHCLRVVSTQLGHGFFVNTQMKAPTSISSQTTGSHWLSLAEAVAASLIIVGHNV